MGSVPKEEILSYSIFIFPLFFYFDYLLDSVMPQHLFRVPYSITNNPHTTFVTPSFHPLPLVHLPSSITSSLRHPLFLSSIIYLPCYLFHILSSNSMPFVLFSIFIFSTSIHYSLPPHSNFDYLSFCPL